LNTKEVENPEVKNPEVKNPEVKNPEVENPEVENPELGLIKKVAEYLHAFVDNGVRMDYPGKLIISEESKKILIELFTKPVEERNKILTALIKYISFKNKPSGQDTEPETDGRPTLGDDSLENPTTIVYPMGLFLGHDFVLPLNIGDDSIDIGNDSIPDLPTVETVETVKTDTASTDTKGIGLEPA